MTPQDIKPLVLAIIAKQAVLKVDDIKMDQSPQDLGLDSLGIVEAIFAIEETFDVSVPFNANEPEQGAFDIATVASIIAAVQGLVAGKTP